MRLRPRGRPKCSRTDVRFVSRLNILCMYVPTLSTRTTNVELTKHRRSLLKSKLFPLGRLATAPGDVHFDVVVRQVKCEKGSDQIFVSVKVTTASSVFVTVAIAPRFEKALGQARAALKQQMLETKRQGYLRRQAESVWRHELQWV